MAGRRDRDDLPPGFMRDCAICKRAFQFGPNRYEGRQVHDWGVLVCDRCDQHDGFVPPLPERLEAYLRERGVAITHNAKGFIVIPGRAGWG